jgi:hypothetical protein
MARSVTKPELDGLAGPGTDGDDAAIVAESLVEPELSRCSMTVTRTSSPPASGHADDSVLAGLGDCDYG